MGYRRCRRPPKLNARHSPFDICPLCLPYLFIHLYPCLLYGILIHSSCCFHLYTYSTSLLTYPLTERNIRLSCIQAASCIQARGTVYSYAHSCLIACLLARSSLARSLARLLACLLARLLACLLACLLAWCWCFCVLVCWFVELLACALWCAHRGRGEKATLYQKGGAWRGIAERVGSLLPGKSYSPTIAQV